MTDTTNTESQAAVSDSLLDAPEAQETKAVDFTAGKPADFPDEFWDAEKNTAKADAIYAKYQEAEARAKGLRDKLAKGAQNAPKDPKEYEVALPEDVAKVIPANDPLIEAARPIAHKYGLSKEAFNGFIGEMAAHVAKLQAEATQPANPEAEKAAIEAARSEALQKLGPNGSQVLQAIGSWGRQLVNDGLLTEADHKAFKDMAYSAESVRVLNILRSLAGQQGVVPMQPATDGRTKAELEDALNKAFLAGDEGEFKRLEAELNRYKVA